jgi:hypothetical protein
MTRKERQKYMKKHSVKFEMKFRNFQDPLFYDPKANDRIFVPTINVSVF